MGCVVAPGKPADVKFQYVSDKEVRIEWKPPYRSNGVIRRYQVAYWDNSVRRRAYYSVTIL